MISGLESRTYEERCAEIGLQTLKERRLEQDLSLADKFSKGMGGLKTSALFNRIPDRAGPVTRLSGSGENFVIPLRKYSFAVRAAKKWNELPEEIKTLNAAKKFKKAVKKLNENGGRHQ
jgi:hypothetical protein